MTSVKFSVAPLFERFLGIPASALPRAYEAMCFAQRRGYAVCYRTDTGKPHIAKPMGQPIRDRVQTEAWEHDGVRWYCTRPGDKPPTNGGKSAD